MRRRPMHPTPDSEVDPSDVCNGMPFLEGVGEARIDLYWPAIADALEEESEKVARGSLDIWRRCLADQRCQLWVMWDGGAITGAVLTEVFEQLAGKTCAVVLVAGGLIEAHPNYLETLETWAADNDCSRFEIQVAANSNSDRWLRSNGFNPRRVHLEKALTDA